MIGFKLSSEDGILTVLQKKREREDMEKEVVEEEEEEEEAEKEQEEEKEQKQLFIANTLFSTISAWKMTGC